MSFIHLNLHTEYSLVDGLIKINDLATFSANQKMSAVTITEKNNVFSAVKFYRAMHNQGIKPLIGAELNLASKNKSTFSNIILLCQHIDGYKNLSKLITKSYVEGQYLGTPLIYFDWLKKYNNRQILTFIIPSFFVSALDITMEGVHYPFIYYIFLYLFLKKPIKV